jgi:PleD family two-component response regulator
MGADHGEQASEGVAQADAGTRRQVVRVAGATHLARGLCTAVTDLAEPHPQDTNISISVGVAATTPTADAADAADAAPEALINLADTLLYRAKSNGRNRVEAASP